MLVYKDGKKVEEPSASGNGRAAAVAAVPKPAWAQSVPERIERLQAKMTKLEAKIGEYSHEKAGHEVAMESAAMSKGEREARKEVMTQLDAQIGRLQAMVQKFAKQVRCRFFLYWKSCRRMASRFRLCAAKLCLRCTAPSSALPSLATATACQQKAILSR